MIYFILIIIIVLICTIFIKQKKYKENIDREKEIKQNTMNIIDKTTFKRAEIDTSYIQKQLFNDIEKYTLANYSLNLELLPQNMFPEFYKETYENIIRENNLNIQKEIKEFKMEKARVVKQDNSTMYSVTNLIVEGTFNINYIYTHPTLTKHVMKKFTQRFVFFNNQNNWQLHNVKEENIINIIEDHFYTLKIN